jgi:phosphinothricin acetyltransferase
VREITIRKARIQDVPRLTEIYNHAVVHLPATFDLEPKTVEDRREWFGQFAETGRYRLLVAEEDRLVLGYAGTTRWRTKAAYDTTVETTIYCAPEAAGCGVGTRLYRTLFEALAGGNVHRYVAGYVPPNIASARLHARFGFREVGTFCEVGFKFGRYWDVTWLERAG